MVTKRTATGLGKKRKNDVHMLPCFLLLGRPCRAIINRAVFCQVFQRVISRTGGPGLTVDQLLEGFKSPLLLLWGELDPWIRPAAADKIQVRGGNRVE